MNYYKKRKDRYYNLKDVYAWLLAGWQVEESGLIQWDGKENLWVGLRHPTGRVKNASVVTEFKDEFYKSGQ